MNEADDILTIDIVSDVVCPWCYLGEKRLDAALAEAAQPVALRWRPYQLDPTIPDGGLDRAEYMAKKFGAGGRLQAAHDNLTRLGAEVGIPFAFDKIKRAPNTLDAHRLIRWANSAGAQGKVVDRLFKAYFVEGRDIGDRDVLIDIAGECDRGQRRAVLHFRRPPRRPRSAGPVGAGAGDGAGPPGDQRARRRSAGRIARAPLYQRATSS
jgi:predicted DsbA family dithiol-disulfide isomerase